LSSPPFLTPGESGHRRRRPRAATIGALALAILAAAVAVLVLAQSTGRSRSLRRASPGARAAASARSGAPISFPPLSATGLALGKPALLLTGIGAQRRDPLQVGFRVPPRSGLLFNLDTGQVLWQRNATKRLRMASLTKMMTALLTVESARPNARVLVTRQAIDSQGSKVGVLPLGRRVRLESLLYGLMLPSGNDAAVALAQRISGSVRRFVSSMNAQAARMGLGCTRYSSPSGYYDEGNFSCAVDLAVLARADLEQPRIARVARTSSAALPFPVKGGKLYLYNNNPLLIYGYPGLTGLKTGYTVAAGKCLVATAERRGVRLGVVLLHSPVPGSQARRLLDAGFERVYGQPRVPEPPIPAGA
jgi:D-alanyl-D-alanine carboxypeptidase